MKRDVKEIFDALMDIHKNIIEMEKRLWEQENQRKVSASDFLQVLIRAERYRWLEPLSDLIVSIEEHEDDDRQTIQGVRESVRHLFQERPANPFYDRYVELIQKDTSLAYELGKLRKLIRD